MFVGYDYGFVFGFLCLLLQASECCRRASGSAVSLRACCSDGGVSNVGVGGG